MTILDKARLRQTIYELSENDDAIKELSGTRNQRFEIQVSEFLEGISEIYYDVDKNSLIWQPKEHSENL